MCYVSMYFFIYLFKDITHIVGTSIDDVTLMKRLWRDFPPKTVCVDCGVESNIHVLFAYIIIKIYDNFMKIFETPPNRPCFSVKWCFCLWKDIRRCAAARRSEIIGLHMNTTKRKIVKLKIKVASKKVLCTKPTDMNIIIRCPLVFFPISLGSRGG